MIRYTNDITAEEYMELRDRVGWMQFPLEEAKICVEKAYMVLCARDGDKAIGVVRLLWDGGYIAFLSDVIVIPEYQGQGLGRVLMESIMAFIHEQLKPGYRFMVSLLAAKGKEEFYQKFGFETRPNETVGAGMHQWLVNEKSE